MTRASLHLEIEYKTRFLFISFKRHFTSAAFHGAAGPIEFHWMEGDLLEGG